MNLRQINEQASAQVAKALTKMVRMPVDVELARLGISRVSELRKANEPESLVAAVQLPITGNLRGVALLALPQQAALLLSDLMERQAPGAAQKFTPSVRAALKEAGNIICGRYMAVLSDALEMKLIENLPHFSEGMFGSIFEGVAVSIAAKEVLAFEVVITMQDMNVKGHFFVMFDTSGESVATKQVQSMMGEATSHA